MRASASLLRRMPACPFRESRRGELHSHGTRISRSEPMNGHYRQTRRPRGDESHHRRRSSSAGGAAKASARVTELRQDRLRWAEPRHRVVSQMLLTSLLSPLGYRRYRLRPLTAIVIVLGQFLITASTILDSHASRRKEAIARPRRSVDATLRSNRDQFAPAIARNSSHRYAMSTY